MVSSPDPRHPSNRRPLVVAAVVAAVLAAALALRLGAYLYVQAADARRIVQPDSATYERPALALLRTGAFAVDPDSPDEPEVMRTPGYPLFIAAVYGAFGERRAALMTTQIVLSVATIGLLGLLALKTAGSGVALGAMVLLAVDPASFLHAQLLLSETLFAAMLVLVALAGVGVVEAENGEKYRAVALGLALALAAHVRPVAYYVIAPALVILVIAKKPGRSWKSVGVLLGLTLVPWIVLVGGWQWRNRMVAGRAEFSFIQNYNLYFYRAAGIVAARDGVSLEEAQDRLRRAMPDPQELASAEASDHYRSEALAIIGRHPALFAKVELAGLMRLLFGPVSRDLRRFLGLQVGESGPAGDLLHLSPPDYFRKWVLAHPFSFALFGFEALYLLVLYSGVTAAFPGVIRGGEVWRIHLMFAGIVATLALLSAGPEAQARFRVPIAPFLALYAALGWRFMLGRFSPFPRNGLGRREASGR